MELENRSFQYGKVALAVRTQYYQLQFVLKVIAICTDIVCYADRSFFAATGLPVCRLCK